MAPPRPARLGPAIFVLLTAGMTIAIGALMAVQGARSQTLPPDELQTLILRFELARSASEVSQLLGAFDSASGQRLRAARFDPRRFAGPATSALTVLWLAILGMASWQVVARRHHDSREAPAAASL